MFKKVKKLFINFFWFVLPQSSNEWLPSVYRIWDQLRSILNDLVFLFLPIKFFIKNFISDFKFSIFKIWGTFWNLVTKHRLMYIVRLSFLIFLLYKPTLLDLDSLYWTLSTLFYFISNNIFFFTSYVLPFPNWSLGSLPFKVLLLFSFFPALFISKRFKRRLLKKNKIILQDDELYLAFKWAQRVFIFTFYFLIWYLFFFFLSIFVPVLYMYVAEPGITNVTQLYYITYFSDTKYLYFISDFFFSKNFFFFTPVFLSFVLKFIYLVFDLYFFPLISYVFLFIFSHIFSFFSYPILFIFSIFKIYFFFLFSFFKSAFILIIFLKKLFLVGPSLLGLNSLFDIFKNFLFSDNFILFLFFIFKFVSAQVFAFFIVVLKFGLSSFISFFAWLIPAQIFQLLSFNFSIFNDFMLTHIYSILIHTLNFSINMLNTYLKDLTIFGLLSTWYEYLNHGVQRGILSNSLINWAFIHLYASIIAFWFLDFDFRVSLKTPPKTPHTLLKEAKRTQDWVPQSMDFLTLQTSETKIYFAMLDISFEHVESLQFIYGDFEYIDEEYDSEDETPDEEELFNESEETLKVREIIESDLGFTKRPARMTDHDPLDPKGSLERHYLSEIVGEPELIYIEEPVKWAFESLYTPTFEELHFRDSLFSDWIFDPDEDLTFFEFLVLFPFLFYCLYVWFFHRKRGKHYRAYLRFFIPSRRLVFSGWWVEDFLGVPLGDTFRYFFDKMRHHTAPDIKFRSVHKFRMYRARQKFKLMQLEAFHFERLRLKLYRDTLTNWENFTARSINFLAPNRKKHYLYSTVRQFKQETRDWAALGDWSKFFWKPEPTPERISTFFDALQVSLARLVESYVNRRGRKKFRKNLWRTIQHIHGHISMPYYPKHWYDRFTNSFLFYPSVTTKYNYSYYNYIGWRDNRSRWRRYAFTPGNVTDKIFDYNRNLQRRDYNLYKRWQKRRRLMRVFQF